MSAACASRAPAKLRKALTDIDLCEVSVAIWAHQTGRLDLRAVALFTPFGIVVCQDFLIIRSIFFWPEEAQITLTALSHGECIRENAKDFYQHLVLGFLLSSEKLFNYDFITVN